MTVDDLLCLEHLQLSVDDSDNSPLNASLTWLPYPQPSSTLSERTRDEFGHNDPFSWQIDFDSPQFKETSPSPVTPDGNFPLPSVTASDRIVDDPCETDVACATEVITSDKAFSTLGVDILHPDLRGLEPSVTELGEPDGRLISIAPEPTGSGKPGQLVFSVVTTKRYAIFFLFL
jgi:hypothetical protein